MVQWDSTMQLDLFITILELQEVKVHDWEKISDKMASKGYPVSKEGCRQHFQKLKREVKAKNSSAPGTPGSAAPSTNGKRKRNKNAEVNGDDDAEFLQTPTKQPKCEKLAKKEKKEDLEEDTEDFKEIMEQPIFKIEDEEEPFNLEREEFF